MKGEISQIGRTDKGIRVTYVGLIINLLLSVLKFMMGILGQSTAMLADAFHSVSDSFSDIVVLIGFRYVKKPIDDTHDYGHGKIETLMTAAIGLMLLGVAIFIAFSSIDKIIKSLQGEIIPRPEFIALYAAIISIIVKEFLYRYALNVGKEIRSPLVIANAWHHRTDSLSSIGAMIGIGGAIFLGESWIILDPLAAVFVSVLIIKVGFKILQDSIKELIETSVDDEKKKELLDLILNVEGVKDLHKLRIRHIGHYYSMGVHILVSKSLNVFEAHQISEKVEDKIKDYLGLDTIVTVHIEPYEEI